MRADLRPIDRTRTGQAVTAWMCDDQAALDQVLDQVAHDPAGTPGLIFGLLEFAAWTATHTGPPDDGDDDEDDDDWQKPPPPPDLGPTSESW